MVTSHGFITFTRWITAFNKEKSNRGILARYFTSYDFFQHTSAKDEFVRKMIENGGSEFLIDTFEIVWNDFQAVPNAKISIPTIYGQGRKFRKRLE